MRTAPYAGLVAGFLLLSAVPALAGEGSSLRGLKPPPDSVDAEGMPPGHAAGESGLKWRGVDTLQELAPRLALYGGSVETRRFASSEMDVRMSMYRPLGPSPALGPGHLNPINNVLPKYTLYRQVTHVLPGGWGLGFGIRQNEYNFSTSNLYSVSAERYAGNFRGAYTLYSGRTDGNDTGSAHRFQVNYFYGDRNTVGLAYTTGRDIENLGLSAGLLPGDARDLTVSGRHWLSTNWALTYDLLSHEQGSLYRRQGLRLGVSRSF